MSDTPATPQARQWEAVEWEYETGKIVRFEMLFGGQKLTIYRYDESAQWRLTSRLGKDWILPAADTAEQAVAEAVVAISQHLDWLREELAAIPLTLPTP
jgi:hypothetical protein